MFRFGFGVEKDPFQVISDLTLFGNTNFQFNQKGEKKVEIW